LRTLREHFMKPIIEIQSLSKKYHIQHLSGGYLSLRERMASVFRSDKSQAEDFWALKDVSFEVNAGESIGIIGRNGAGKSTLLKVLSKITPPTSGKIVSRGRIASLLEVGTGFHPELTGRENIFFNGSLLGMKRMEIAAKFDEIVDFSGVEKFLDTPLKHYSSGMQLRLAFAVAAFLEPEILIIDEVLAVGDAEFQKKCLDKMKDIRNQEGRTILFVSHNMGSVSQLCDKGILLANGKTIVQSDIETTINAYLGNIKDTLATIKRDLIKDTIHFIEAFMCNENEEPKSEYRHDEDIFIKIDLHVNQFNENLELAMRLMDRNKNPVFTIHEKLVDQYKNTQIVSFKVKLPGCFLTPNSFSWVMCINHPGVEIYDLQDDVLNFSIIETGSDFARYNGANYGNVFAKYEIV
jgi:lipopolysaccharide transport system ATP-binding protein